MIFRNFVVFFNSPESFWTFGSERFEFFTRYWAFGLVIDHHHMPLPD